MKKIHLLGLLALAGLSHGADNSWLGRCDNLGFCRLAGYGPAHGPSLSVLFTGRSQAPGGALVPADFSGQLRLWPLVPAVKLLINGEDLGEIPLDERGFGLLSPQQSQALLQCLGRESVELRGGGQRWTLAAAGFDYAWQSLKAPLAESVNQLPAAAVAGGLPRPAPWPDGLTAPADCASDTARTIDLSGGYALWSVSCGDHGKFFAVVRAGKIHQQLRLKVAGEGMAYASYENGLLQERNLRGDGCGQYGRWLWQEGRGQFVALDRGELGLCNRGFRGGSWLLPERVENQRQ